MSKQFKVSLDEADGWTWRGCIFVDTELGILDVPVYGAIERTSEYGQLVDCRALNIKCELFPELTLKDVHLGILDDDINTMLWVNGEAV